MHYADRLSSRRGVGDDPTRTACLLRPLPYNATFVHRGAEQAVLEFEETWDLFHVQGSSLPRIFNFSHHLNYLKMHTEHKPMPCPICKDLDPNLFEKREQRDPFLYIDCNRLQSRSVKCSSCVLLLKILQRYFKRFDMPPRRVKMVYRCDNILLEFGSVREVFLYATGKTPWSSVKIQRHVTGSTYSKNSLGFVKHMLRTCSAEHDVCRPRRDARLPTRLLDLGTETDCKASVRLWETNDSPTSHSIRYACLSHCWGKTQPIKTTSSNILKHKEKIPFEDLPRTFADAVDFTRKMGIRYLWIDSL